MNLPHYFANLCWAATVILWWHMFDHMMHASPPQPSTAIPLFMISIVTACIGGACADASAAVYAASRPKKD